MSDHEFLGNTELVQRLKEVCTRDLLLECVVSQTLKTPEEWGRALELAESDIHSIRADYANHPSPHREMLFQILWMWYQQKGQAATVEELLYAAYRLKEQTISDGIRDRVFSDVHVPENEERVQRRNSQDFQDYLVSLRQSEKQQHEGEVREKENALMSLEDTCKHMAQQQAELEASVTRRNIQEAAREPPTFQRLSLACHEDPGTQTCSTVHKAHEQSNAVIGPTPSSLRLFSGQMYPYTNVGDLPPTTPGHTVITIRTPANITITFSTEASIVIDPDGTIRMGSMQQ